MSPSLATCLTAGLLAACLLAGCGGSDKPHTTAPANTQENPGPNPTTGDPGPNNTSNGPQTLQGKLVARLGCIELDGNAANEPETKYQLNFTSEKVSLRGAIVLTGSDGTRFIKAHDTVFVAGHPGTGSGPCGQLFNVDKVVAVVADGG